MNRGKLIVLEGPVGSGKSTQAQILLQRLEAAHLSTKLFNYPDISNSLIARSINRMKNNPDYTLSHASRVLLDAVTSSETMQTINQALNDGIYCICESSYIATIVKYCYQKNIDNYEDVAAIMSYANMAIKPDLTIVFDAPPKVLIDRKYSTNPEFSPSIEDLEKVRTGYLLEAKTHNYSIIFSTDSVDSISGLVWDQVAQCLAIRVPDAKSEIETMPTSVSDILNYKTESVLQDPLIVVEDSLTVVDMVEPSEVSSKNFVDSVLNTSDNIYGFKDRLNIVPIAASLARSKGDDLNDLLIEEFDAQQEGNLKIFKKVVDHYGANTIKQLSSHYLVIEGVSDLLIRKIESNLSGSYLEQPSHKIKEYFIPSGMDEKTRRDYKQTLNKIYTNHTLIVDKLEKHLNKTNRIEKNSNKQKAREIAKNLLPVASKSSIAVFATNKKIETLITSLVGARLNESNITGKRILSNMKQLEPMFFANLSNLKRNISNTTIKDIIQEKMMNGFSSDFEVATLVDYYPKNEIDLVPYMIYENSELSLHELRNEVNKWAYSDKSKILDEYLNQQQISNKAMENAKYSFDIVCDYSFLIELLHQQVVTDLTWQNLTPRYGYEIPKLIEDADLVEKYQECFDLSLKLYSQMKLKNYHDQAQYVTLFGHRMRLGMTFNANDANTILGTKNYSSAEYNDIILQISEKLSQVHPQIIQSIVKNNNKSVDIQPKTKEEAKKSV